MSQYDRHPPLKPLLRPVLATFAETTRLHCTREQKNQFLVLELKFAMTLWESVALCHTDRLVLRRTPTMWMIMHMFGKIWAHAASEKFLNPYVCVFKTSPICMMTVAVSRRNGIIKKSMRCHYITLSSVLLASTLVWNKQSQLLILFQRSHPHHVDCCRSHFLTVPLPLGLVAFIYFMIIYCEQTSWDMVNVMTYYFSFTP